MNPPTIPTTPPIGGKMKYTMASVPAASTPRMLMAATTTPRSKPAAPPRTPPTHPEAPLEACRVTRLGSKGASLCPPAPMIGWPHWGQDGSRSETSTRHFGQVINAIDSSRLADGDGEPATLPANRCSIGGCAGATLHLRMGTPLTLQPVAPNNISRSGQRAEPRNSATGGAGGAVYRATPFCPAGLLQRLGRRGPAPQGRRWRHLSGSWKVWNTQ